jgi:hypothetical protein
MSVQWDLNVVLTVLPWSTNGAEHIFCILISLLLWTICSNLLHICLFLIEMPEFFLFSRYLSFNRYICYKIFSWAGGMGQTVECLPTEHKTLSSNLKYCQKKKKQTKKILPVCGFSIRLLNGIFWWVSLLILMMMNVWISYFYEHHQITQD